MCRPLYSSLSESFPWIKPLLDGCLANREKWADLAEKVEMGLTWIDHDTIEKPIEEITVGTGEAQDIEFTVETLHCPSETPKKSEISKKVTSFDKSGIRFVGMLNFYFFQRSFRTSKSPLRSGSQQQGKGGSFFHRRLSSKSPNRSTYMSTTDIQLDDRRASPKESGHADLCHGFDLLQLKVKKCSMSCSNILLPRSTSSLHQVDEPSTYSSNPESADAPGGDRGRTWL